MVGKRVVIVGGEVEYTVTASYEALDMFNQGVYKLKLINDGGDSITVDNKKVRIIK